MKMMMIIIFLIEIPKIYMNKIEKEIVIHQENLVMNKIKLKEIEIL